MRKLTTPNIHFICFSGLVQEPNNIPQDCTETSECSAASELGQAQGVGSGPPKPDDKQRELLQNGNAVGDESKKHTEKKKRFSLFSRRISPDGDERARKNTRVGGKRRGHLVVYEKNKNEKTASKIMGIEEYKTRNEIEERPTRKSRWRKSRSNKFQLRRGR